MSAHSQLELASVEHIYESALEGTLFDVVLDIVSRALPKGAVLFFGEDTARAAGNFFLHRGLNADAIRSYVTRLAVQNPWFEQQWRQWPGRVYQDFELLDRETFVQSAFYKDWLSHQGPLECATGVVLFRAGTRQLVLEVRYPPHHAEQLRQQATAVLERLASHVVRASRILQLRNHHPLENQFTSNLLELLSFPVFLLDEECKVHNMNSRADALARRMDAIFVSADGYLHAMEPECDMRLHAAAEGLTGRHRHGSEVLSLRKSDRRSRYFLSLTALGLTASHASHVLDSFDNMGQRIALIVQDSAEALRITHDALWRTFGLTSAEAELAMSLLEGSTIGEYAAAREVSKQTLRNQLVSIMRKTDTSRQPQLVALLTRLAMSSTH